MKKTKTKTPTYIEAENITKYILDNFGYNDIITFEVFQNFTHFNLLDVLELNFFKKSVMIKVRNWLINKGYVLKSIRNVGYYILKPNQIASYTYRTYIKKPLRLYEKAKTILVNTDTDFLNTKEFNEHKLTLDLNNKLETETNKLINNETYKNLK